MHTTRQHITHALAALSLIAAFVPFPVAADHKVGTTYDYLIATSFLCDLAADACPAISKTRDGQDVIELAGAGTFNTETDAATGGGTFVHKDADGTVLATGTWTALELESFHTYGSGATQGFAPETEGGKAKLRVHLAPASGGPGFDALLRITCTLGDHIPSSAVEGVRVKLEDGPNFREEMSGFTLFVRTSE